MTEINPNEVHAATTELTSDAALRLVRNGVAQEGVDKLSLDREQLRSLIPVTSHKLDSWSVADQKASGRCWIFAGLNSAAAKRVRISRRLPTSTGSSPPTLACHPRTLYGSIAIRTMSSTARAPIPHRSLPRNTCLRT